MMDEAEYDRLYKRPSVVVGAEQAPEGLEPQTIDVGGVEVAPLRITLVNATPQEMNAAEHEALRERVEVVGHVDGPGGGVDIMRRSGGEHDHQEEWRHLMRRFGRVR